MKKVEHGRIGASGTRGGTVDDIGRGRSRARAGGRDDKGRGNGGGKLGGGGARGCGENGVNANGLPETAGTLQRVLLSIATEVERDKGVGSDGVGAVVGGIADGKSTVRAVESVEPDAGGDADTEDLKRRPENQKKRITRHLHRERQKDRERRKTRHRTESERVGG